MGLRPSDLLGKLESAKMAGSHYNDQWLGEIDEAPMIDSRNIAATRALGGLKRLWLKIDATPEEYLAWEEVMERWLKPRIGDYGPYTCYSAALDRFEKTTMPWWRCLRYDLKKEGNSCSDTWEEVKRLVRQRFVPANFAVKKVNKAAMTIPFSDNKADVDKVL